VREREVVEQEVRAHLDPRVERVAGEFAGQGHRVAQEGDCLVAGHLFRREEMSAAVKHENASEER
jgi:hypothetical protein